MWTEGATERGTGIRNLMAYEEHYGRVEEELYVNQSVWEGNL